jgi:hypothetical protein
MDRSWCAFFVFGLVLLPHTTGTSAADNPADKDLPYSICAIQVIPSEVQAAVEYCKSLGGQQSTGMLGQIVESIAEDDSFSKLDLTQPFRVEICLDPGTSSAVQLMALNGDGKTIVVEMFEGKVSAVPGFDDLYAISEGEDENKGEGSAFLHSENGRTYIAVGEEGLTAEVADKLLTRLKRDDKHNSRYQWSISSRPCEINPPMRKLLLKQLTQVTSVQLQQRNDEDDVDYQLRSLWGKTKLAILNTFAADCEYFEAGFNVFPGEGRGTIELTLKARENSTLARWMTKTSKASSPFSGMLQDESHTAVALSLVLGETQKESIKSLIAATNTYLVDSHQLPANSAAAFAKMIHEQVKRGQAHAYLQMDRFHPAVPFDSFSGGFSLKNGDAIVPVLTHVMNIIARDNPTVLIGEAEGDQPAIHFWNNPFDISEGVTIAITANSNGIWFAFGEEIGTREKYQVVETTAKGDLRTVEGTRVVTVKSTGARERLENLIADTQQARQSRERSFLLETFVSSQVWPALALSSQFDSEPETRVETYEVQVPNDDGTMRTEQRQRTVVSKHSGGFKNSASADAPEVADTAAKIQQTSATKEVKNPKDNQPHVGQIRIHTESIKHGLRIHGEFEKSGVAALMLFPEFLGVAIESLGLE